MVRKRQKRLLSLFLTLFMLFSILPTRATAYWHEEWDDETDCEHCGNKIFRSEDFCDCGGGSPHCSSDYDSNCYQEYHCVDCGNCGADWTICEDCGRCDECWLQDDAEGHCFECGNCGVEICSTCTDEFDEPICTLCAATEKSAHCPWCEGCYTAGEVEKCEKSHDTVGFYWCIDCCESDGHHCSNCGVHVPDNDDVHGWCACGGDHCFECSDNDEMYCCNECGAIYCAVNGDDMGDICHECHYCLSCAEELLKHCPECEACGNEPCESGGRHCVECCVLCEGCGECLYGEDKEICDTCGLCMECCRELAKEDYGCDCGEYCIEDSDFQDHLCPNCRQCFDQADQCEFCGLCEECCAENSECDEGMCVEDPDYQDHFCEYCGACGHEAEICETCVEAGEHRCVNCCLSETQDYCEHEICMNSGFWKCHYDSVNGVCREKPLHTYSSSGYCLNCGAKKSAVPNIIRQPKNRTVKVSTAKNPKVVSFSVQAACDDELEYQWYNANNQKLTDSGLTTGTKTSKLTTGTTVCIADPTVYKKQRNNYQFYCIITNKATGQTARTKTVSLICEHNFNVWRADLSSVSHKFTYTYPDTYSFSGTANISWSESDTHSLRCCDRNCPADPQKTEEHVWGPYDYTKYPAYKKADGTKVKGYAVRTCVVCGKNQYREYDYVDKHDHIWSDKAEPLTLTYQKTDKKGNTTNYVDNSRHAFHCTVLGCTEYSNAAEHAWSAWETTQEATDHKVGSAVRHCVVCGYEETQELKIVPHVHTFPEKSDLTQWYELEDQRDYVHYNAKQHYVTCTGFVWDDNKGEYVRCTAKGRQETHKFDITLLDGDDSTARVKRVCRCGYKRTFVSTAPGEYAYREAHAVVSEFSDIVVYPPSISQKGKYTTADWNECYNNGQPYTAAEKGTPLKVLPDSRIVVTASNTGFMFTKASDWLICAMPQDNLNVNYAVTGNNTLTVYMPASDLYIGGSYERKCDHPDDSRYREYVESSAKEPTCTKNGKAMDLKCTLCETVLKYGDQLPALGHDFQLDKSTIRQPGCTSKGYEGSEVCTHCGKVKRGDEIPALGHKPAYYDYDYDANHRSKKHFMCCGECDYQLKETSEPHDFIEKESQGKVYQICKVCNYIQDKEKGYWDDSASAVTVKMYFGTDNLRMKEKFRVRFYPTTVSDNDIYNDMRKDVSALGTEYACYIGSNSVGEGKYNKGYTTFNGGKAYYKYDYLTVLNAPNDNKIRKMAVSIVGDDRVAPYIVEQKNPNFSAKLLLWGDTNADGNVDLLDVTVLARYNAEWDGYDKQIFDLKAMDLDGSGDIDLLDVTLLARHVAEWDGYENPRHYPSA